MVLRAPLSSGLMLRTCSAVATSVRFVNSVCSPLDGDRASCKRVKGRCSASVVTPHVIAVAKASFQDEMSIAAADGIDAAGMSGLTPILFDKAEIWGRANWNSITIS